MASLLAVPLLCPGLRSRRVWGFSWPVAGVGLWCAYQSATALSALARRRA